MNFPGISEMLDALKQNRTEEVIPVLERLTEQLPMYTAAHVLLARAYEAEERRDDAHTAWQQAHFLMPGSPIVERGLRRTLIGPPERAAVAAELETAGAAAGIPSAADSYEDLDRLIEELEGARIQPAPDLEAIPAPDLEDDIEDMVSETLARIYANQGQYVEAARVYAKLADQEPERADTFWQKAAEMRERATEEQEEKE